MPGVGAVLFFWVLFLVAVVACGGGAPQEAVDPYAEVYRDGSESGLEAPATLDVSSLSLVGQEERSRLATLVAQVPESSDWDDGGDGDGDGSSGERSETPRVGATATVAVEGRGGVPAVRGVTRVPVVTATPEAVVVVVYAVASCEDDFREMVAQDRGLVGRWYELHHSELDRLMRRDNDEFDAEYVMRLNERFESGRPECVDSGWAPEFSYGVVCTGETLAGLDITSNSFYGEYDGASIIGRPRVGDYVWNPTGQSSYQVLIHFDRLPMRQEGGCWGGSIWHHVWSWQTEDGLEFGIDYPDAPVCNQALLGIAERIFGEGWTPEAWFLESSDYLRDHVGDCPRHRLWPVLEAQEGCPLEREAGLGGEGELVVHWDQRPVYPGKPVCWVGVEAEGQFEWEGYDSEGEVVDIVLPGV